MFNLVEPKAVYHHVINVIHASLPLLIIILSFSLFPSLFSHNLLFVPILSSAKYKYNGYVTSRKFSPIFHIHPLLHSSISRHLTWLTCFSAVVFAPTPLHELLHTISALLVLCKFR